MNHRIRLVALWLAILATNAWSAIDYSDTWWTPAEPGWGANFAQQANTIYVTFYVYGSDGKSTWFAALLARDGAGERFTGVLSRTSGTPFGAPNWNGYTINPAGSATFTATSSTAGTLAYTVDGFNVTKAIERITLAPLNIAGVYLGGVSGRRSGCSGASVIIDPIQIEVLHSPSTGAVRIDQRSTTTGTLFCRMEGVAVQTGKLMTIANASYSCSDGWNKPARVFNLRPTPGGFEAQWFSDGGGGCTESGQLSGVTQTP